MKIEDLLEIYQLFIRSCAEYCAVAFHSSLTQKETKALERLQSTCLKVILQDDYVSYSSALEMTGLQTLYNRREERCLNYSLKSIKHNQNSRFFPLNPSLQNDIHIREREHFLLILLKLKTTEIRQYHTVNGYSIFILVTNHFPKISNQNLKN